MSTASGPITYQVSYSQLVRHHLHTLAHVTRARGDGEIFLAAMREFHRLLCIYPQFGDPLIDLVQATGQVRIGVVHPIVMRYGVFEELRIVTVAALPALFPRSASNHP